MKQKGHENKGNDDQVQKVLIVKQILLSSTIGNVWTTVWRICKLISGFKGKKCHRSHNSSHASHKEKKLTSRSASSNTIFKKRQKEKTTTTKNLGWCLGLEGYLAS